MFINKYKIVDKYSIELCWTDDMHSVSFWLQLQDNFQVCLFWPKIKILKSICHCM